MFSNSELVLILRALQEQAHGFGIDSTESGSLMRVALRRKARQIREIGRKVDEVRQLDGRAEVDRLFSLESVK